MNKLNYYLPGTFLIMSGILIVVFPEILIALIASVIMMAGIASLYLGHKIKESNEVYSKKNEDDWINYDRFQYRYDKPLFRSLGRWF